MNERRCAHTNGKIEELVTKYSSKLYRTSYLLCRRKEDAEDIVQEVFIRYMKKQPVFKDKDHEKAWFLRTTINLTKDYLKSYWNRNTQGLDIEIPYVMEADNQVFSSLYRIPRKYQIVLLLHYQEGYSIKEIAEILNRNPSTIGTQLSRAKECLRKELENE